MTLTAVLLGAILLVLVCGGIFLYRVVRRYENYPKRSTRNCRHLRYLRNSYQFDRAFTQHSPPLTERTIGHEQNPPQMVC